jgi:signal peptidase II
MIFKEYLNKKFYFNLSIILIIFFLDRITKNVVIQLNQENFGQEIFSTEYLNIDLIWNQGIAFGLFSFNENNVYNILTALIALVILVILVMILKSDGFKRFSLLMIMGGALGNLYDRIFFSAVPDFFDFHVGNFHWFIFNVADIFITIGVIFMILIEFTDNNKKKENEKI